MHNIQLMRHDWVWLRESALGNARYLGPAPIEAAQALEALQHWLGRQLPLIVARQIDTQGERLPTGQLRLGLAEPLSMGKRRMAFQVSQHDVLRRGSGPTLAQALDHLPSAWQADASRLLHVCQRFNIHCCLFGSAALQVATGLDCLHAGSDLDLIATPGDWTSAMALCETLHEISVAGAGFNMDAEIRSPYGDDVHWRELFQQENKVLAKSTSQVRLMEYDEFKHAFNAQQRGAA